MLFADGELDVWLTGLITGWLRLVPSVAALIMLMGIDIATGLMAGWITKTLSSETSGFGTLRKLIRLLMVAAGLAIEIVVPQIPWGRLFALFFCITESISIIENAARAGVPFPPNVLSALQRIREMGTKVDLLGVFGLGPQESKPSVAKLPAGAGTNESKREPYIGGNYAADVPVDGDESGG